MLGLARQSRGQDPFGYLAEFVNLVNLAKSLAPSTVSHAQPPTVPHDR